MAMDADGDGTEIGAWPSPNLAGPPLVLPLLFC